MKRISLTALFLLIFVGIAYADIFQFKFISGNNRYNVKFSSVQVFDAQGNIRFKGSTDKYGRITIRLPNANYNCKVFYENQWRQTSLRIDRSPNLKILYLR